MRVTLLLLGAALACGAAQAREGNTYEDELRIYTDDLALQCKSVTDQLASFRRRSDPLTGYNLKDAVQSLCHCLPQPAEAEKSGQPAPARPPILEAYFQADQGCKTRR
jgi:hypothetical protein